MNSRNYFLLLRLLKRSIILTIFVFLDYSSASAQLFFDFEQNDLSPWQQSDSGHWACSKEMAIDNMYSLHHIFDNPVAGTDQISYVFSQSIDFSDTVIWSFKLKHTYNPSSSNHWAVFLVSNAPAQQMNPAGMTNAFIFGVNYSGSNDIPSLWKQENGKITLLASMPVNWENQIKDSVAGIEIIRFPEGKWSLQIKNYKSECVESWLPYAAYFGIYYKYSSTQDCKLWLDDIRINATFQNDNIAPLVDTFYLESSRELMLTFSEPIDTSKISLQNFSNSGVKSIRFPNQQTIVLLFEKEFSEGINKISFQNIADLKGNINKEGFVELIYHKTRPFDMMISEIMFDPEPVVELPACEYIELFNRSDFDIELKDWKLVIGTHEYFLPETLIKSKEYTIVTSSSCTSEFSKLGKVLHVFTSKYSLTNDGVSIRLLDQNNQLISFVNYDERWIDTAKADGGWSIEIVDPDNFCGGQQNWKTSESRTGGTPGAQNSVYRKNPDKSYPELLKVRVLSDTTILLEFSESLNLDQALLCSNYHIKNFSDPKTIDFYDNDYKTFNLKLQQPLMKSKVYTLQTGNNICDCAGNKLKNNSIRLSMPENPDSLDLILNEILFDAFVGGVDFVEVYNRSRKVLDAGRIRFVVYDTIENKVKSACKLAEEGSLLFPGGFMACTKNIEDLKKFYSIKDSSVTQMSDFPALDDNHGCIALMDFQTNILDKFHYDKKYHSGFLTTKEGVSLERISYEVPTDLPSVWQSAAQTSGFATPGYTNSVYTTEIASTTAGITINPEVFTPNRDGIDDVVRISLPEQTAPTISWVSVFNASGKKVKQLLNKEYFGANYTVSWDGSSDSGQLQATGIYVIYVQCLSEDGKKQEFKKTCVLNRK